MPEDEGVDHKRKYVSIARFQDEAIPTFVAHYDCVHNQEVALRNRVLGDVPPPTSSGLERLRKQVKKIKKLLPCVIPNDYGVMPAMYSGMKRRRYERAEEQVLESGVTKSDAKVKMFVKFEKIEMAKINPDPRAIQFRSPKYCVELARYLKPCEHLLYNLTGDGRVLPSTRVIGKGLSSTERATLLVRKMQAFDDPRIVSIDASRFDQHVSLEMLELEHSIYLHMCPDPWFQTLLSWQLVNYGVSSKGIRYVARGRRMSGDMNTALGNCLLMVVMVSTFMRGRKYDILDDGDDCLVILESGDLPWLQKEIGPAFLEFGHEIKVENVAAIPEGVQWCQSRPVQYKPGKWKFVRNVWKVLGSSLIGSKYFTSTGARAKLVNTIGMAELVLNLGIPVLQEYALALMRNAATDEFIDFQEADPMYYRVHRELSRMNLKQLTRLDPAPITRVARESFWLAFGIEPSRQIQLEDRIRSWRFSLEGLSEGPPMVDKEWGLLDHEQTDASPLWV